LSARLVAEFKKRADNKAYRTGTTIVETTVFVKAPRKMAYGKIVKVIDALKGAGADPVGLQIDDLN
jgi:biopolymer transport protein ExbD